MLYGIAIIVVAAFIGLIVINMRSGRTKPADTPSATEPVQPPVVSKEEPIRTTVSPRKIPATSRNWEQSDDEYRNALRSFHGKTSGSRDKVEDKEDTVPDAASKDDAYREGLRSLTKQDE